jgi:hypothetical protein
MAKVKMREDFLYEGTEFKKGEQYDADKLPARLLNGNYVEFPPEEKPLEIEKIPAASVPAAKLASEVKPIDAKAVVSDSKPGG